jgi:hypothetical protein
MDTSCNQTANLYGLVGAEVVSCSYASPDTEVVAEAPTNEELDA